MNTVTSFLDPNDEGTRIWKIPANRKLEDRPEWTHNNTALFDYWLRTGNQEIPPDWTDPNDDTNTLTAAHQLNYAARTAGRMIEICNLCSSYQSDCRNALSSAVEAGKLLTHSKQGMWGKQWEGWLKGWFPLSSRTARRWMKLAHAVESGLLNLDTVSSISEAYRRIRRSRPKRSPYQMPAPGERLLLWSPGENVATFEPVGIEYMRVTWTEDCHVLGTKRCVRVEAAWHFLISQSCVDWEGSQPFVQKWEDSLDPKAANPNLEGEGLDEWCSTLDGKEVA